MPEIIETTVYRLDELDDLAKDWAAATSGLRGGAL